MLKECGIKPSKHRIAIFEYLFNHRVHPTVDIIFKDLFFDIPTLSKTTVYNTLKLFSEHGIIKILNIDENNLRYDADISEHAHFKCDKCKRLIDIPMKNRKFEGLETCGLIISEYQIYCKGICNECQNSNIQ